MDLEPQVLRLRRKDCHDVFLNTFNGGEDSWLMPLILKPVTAAPAVLDMVKFGAGCCPRSYAAGAMAPIVKELLVPWSVTLASAGV